MTIARVEEVCTVTKKGKTQLPAKANTLYVPVEDLGEGAELSVSHLEGASLAYGAFKLDDRVTVTLQCEQSEEGLNLAYVAGSRLVRKFMRRATARSSKQLEQAIKDLRYD